MEAPHKVDAVPGEPLTCTFRILAPSTTSSAVPAASMVISPSWVKLAEAAAASLYPTLPEPERTDHVRSPTRSKLMMRWSPCKRPRQPQTHAMDEDGEIRLGGPHTARLRNWMPQNMSATDLHRNIRSSVELLQNDAHRLV